MKKIVYRLLIGLFSIFILLLLLIIGSYFADFYNSNFKYSIATPQIMGEFRTDNNSIYVYGIENIVGEDIATLNINETRCMLSTSEKSCFENRVVIIGLGEINVFPYHKEYRIKYADKNKILFDDKYSDISETSGEIDLNSKTLTYTVKNAGINNNETRRIEVITDNQVIEKTEKQIIRRYLRKRLFN